MKRLLQTLALLFILALAAGTASAVSFEEIKALAEQGDANAQYTLGSMYAEGLGVPKDYTKAREWLEKAAAQGNAYAQATLGMIGGREVPKDYTNTRGWYKKTAAQGDTDAQERLDAMYANSQRTVGTYKKDRAEWWIKAITKSLGIALLFALATAARALIALAKRVFAAMQNISRPDARKRTRCHAKLQKFPRE